MGAVWVFFENPGVQLQPFNIDHDYEVGLGTKYMEHLIDIYKLICVSIMLE